MIESLINEYKMLPMPSDGRVVELDMGCGRGGFTLQLARRYPEREILASDVMSGRLRRIENKVKYYGLKNLRLIRSESGAMTQFQLPARSVDRIHILFPDPWPKEKRKARRLVNTAFLCDVARILKPNGILHLATDDCPYFNDWVRMLAFLPFFQDASGAVDDVADLKTDFELQWEADGIPGQHLVKKLIDN